LGVRVSTVPWATHGAALRALREIVFIREQGVPRDLEWDGHDEVSQHFAAYDERDVLVGTARLMPTGQIGRMAVVKDRRGTGIGRQLLDLAVAEARRQGLRHIHLHAQSHAQDFYRKSGFVVVGAEFAEAGIPHVEMTLQSQATQAAAPLTTSTMQTFRGEAQARDGLYAIIEGARRYVDVQSRALDHALFGTDRAVVLISALARRHATSRVRILIDDSSTILSRGHRLVELARRLPSKIEIRRATDVQPARDGTFVVADESAVWLVQEEEQYVGWFSPHAPIRAERLLAEYTRRFDRAVNDPDLRLLRL
jgi:predicted GNAT family N-acyltransferase